MIEFSGRGILLDIEGTTSSISYIYDVMFPFARRELENYLRSAVGSSELEKVRDLIAADAGHGSFDEWAGEGADETQKFRLIRDEVVRLMDDDVKATGLKKLQGLIWRAGYKCGELKSHVYDDVPGALEAWNAAGRDVRIYSSGSVEAQKLFFGHTEKGDLLHHFRGHYDTTLGAKREVESYEKIAVEFGLPAAEILFISDVAAELNAARYAGMTTALCVRPTNETLARQSRHNEITEFDQIRLV